MLAYRFRAAVSLVCSGVIASCAAFASIAIAAPSVTGTSARAEHARVVEHWTPARRAAATPRDFVIDERGYGYVKLGNGSLQPYGHDVAASSSSPRPMAKPGGGGGGSGGIAPSISGMDPGAAATIGAAYTFKANVTDDGVIRSVSFRVGPKGGRQQSFAATASGNTYSAQLSGFSSGA